MLTLSKVHVALAEVLWLVTARPTYAICAIGIVPAPTCVQLVPSDDLYVVNVLPLRVSLTQCGAIDTEPEVLTLVPSVTSRRAAAPTPPRLLARGLRGSIYSVGRDFQPFGINDLDMVAQIFPRWNRMADWLREAEGYASAA